MRTLSTALATLAACCAPTTRLRAFATTYTVTNTDDAGAGSLRQAILDANGNAGADTIAFAILGSGVHTIAPRARCPSSRTRSRSTATRRQARAPTRTGRACRTIPST